MKKKLLCLFSLFTFFGYAQMPVEGFEGAWPPEGWSTYQNDQGAEALWNQGFTAHNGNYSAHIGGQPALETEIAQDWLVTPPITIGPDMQLRFYAMFVDFSADDPLCKVMICPAGVDLSDLSNYTLLQQVDVLSEDYAEEIVDLPQGTPGQEYHIAFLYQMEPGMFGNSLVIDDVQVVGTVGIIDNTVQSVIVYPNPVKGMLTVQTADETVSLIEIYDINGRLCLFQADSFTVNMQSLNAGFYFVKVIAGNSVMTKKIVKQ